MDELLFKVRTKVQQVSQDYRKTVYQYKDTKTKSRKVDELLQIVRAVGNIDMNSDQIVPTVIDKQLEVRKKLEVEYKNLVNIHKILAGVLEKLKELEREIETMGEDGINRRSN